MWFQYWREALREGAGDSHIHAGHTDGVRPAGHHHRPTPGRQVRQTPTLLRRPLDDDQRGQLRFRYLKKFLL